MSETMQYALVIVLTSLVGLIAVMANRLSERLKVPVPALVLVAAAVATKLIPALHAPGGHTVERIVTVALVFILFDGGMHIGWDRFRAAAAPIAVVGVLGTVLTTVAVAAVLHAAFGISWYAALLVATAVAPTDPAMVFSVLGQREIAGRSGTILEGESGANDPVGIALMASLLSAGGLSGHALGHAGIEFILQLVIGAVIGLVGGRCLLWFMRRVPLPSEGLYPLRTLASALLLYGVATLAHGSGFLAVFIAGILIGDGRAPYKLEIRRFHAAIAGLAEIVAFAVLGLTVDLGELAKPNVWLPGLAIGAVLAFVIRPVLVGLCLVPARLDRREVSFVLFAGLKGAVPILLGVMLREAHVPGAERLFGIVVIVVVFSVIVQGSLTPTVAHLLKLPMRTIEPEPWALGVRLRDEPEGVYLCAVEPGSSAEGHTISQLDNLGEDAWISLIVRDGQLIRVTGQTRLHAGDDVLVLADPQQNAALAGVFAATDPKARGSSTGPRDMPRSP
jgi:cell volume regulation protein A